MANVGNTTKTSHIPLDVDDAISKYFETLDVDYILSKHFKTLDIDYILSKYFKTLNVDQILMSQAPGLFVCLISGLVGAVLKSLAILVLFLWVGRLKGVTTQTDTNVA